VDHQLKESVSEVRARVEDGHSSAAGTATFAGHHAAHGRTSHASLRAAKYLSIRRIRLEQFCNRFKMRQTRESSLHAHILLNSLRASSSSSTPFILKL